ncbi:MAG TPA: hypothetical protein VGR40_12170 [Candidatus Binatus sp.]|nr:hypothetical protein [Candidatus Binatus sp.]
MPRVTVGRWGKNLAVRFPREIVEAAGLADGEQVEIGARVGQVLIRRAAPQFSLEELFAGKSAREWRAEYSGAFDWGPDAGREAFEE